MSTYKYDPDGEIVSLIYEAREKGQTDGRRPHLGCSIIGKECAREIWYIYRWASPQRWSGRMLRLFYRGQREEEVFIEDLESIGCKVWSIDKEGKQYRVSFGEIAGSVDGIATGIPGSPKTPHLLEFKTHNDRSFKLLMKNGLIDSKPEHYIQMQCYMKGLKLKRGLYMAVSKNTDEIYTERVHYNPTTANEAIARGQDIIESKVPPERISNRPDWYKCKFCNFTGTCHQGLPLVKSCRTCRFANTGWSCGQTGKTLTTEEQKQGCEQWQSI